MGYVVPWTRDASFLRQIRVKSKNIHKISKLVWKVKWIEQQQVIVHVLYSDSSDAALASINLVINERFNRHNVTDNFSGPGGALGRVCVQAVTCDLDIWHAASF